ncbi:GEVED domain-containing protein [Hymenobacter properus]|uniref:T9SS type A sorting domain-containing protein n=1 Tax=Hymenobacter properus TaxID=2791026 RepID=A0A931BRB2_9BACT|nr:GEVED domain-containing protein [Hymenobacter properus]MBF9144175.1 T9SS type A sorting domain-containing protein [Hymenobacter properus]MBR7722992.1 T9SS type A sorting domain-containing protein [Microvirga sp. SRT04]
MLKPFTSFARLAFLALVGAFALPARGQTYTPVALTGFTHDIIANGTGAVNTTTTADIDGAAATGGTGYTLMAQDYVGPTGQVPNTTTYPASTYPALETSGLITSALNSAITYQLGPYSGNNALRLFGANATGTLSFATPSAASELYVIGTSGNAASTLDVTVNFADGTTQLFAGQVIADWFASSQTNVVREKLGRVSRGDNSVQYTGSPVGPRFYQLKLALNAANVTKNITGITFTKAAAAGNTVLLAVTAGVYPVCAAAPTGLTAAATTTSGGTTALTTACSSTSIYLSVSGVPNQAGYSYQWQSSTNGTSYADISGATSPTYTATGQMAATYYRARVTCLYDGTGGTAVSSAPVQVAQTAFDNCYCTPSSSSGCGTYAQLLKVEIPGTTLSNTSTCSSSPYYTNYTSGAATTATLSPGASYPMSITLGRYAKAGLWIDYDHSGTFDASEYMVVGTNSTNTSGSTATVTPTLNIPSTALTGTTRMRVRTQYYLVSTSYPLDGTSACISTTYGETEDYTITIAPSLACTGTPPAVTATAPAATVCGGTAFTLNATGIAAGTTGLSYQWQSSPAGANTFTNLGAAQTSSAYSVANQTAATDYRVIVTCTASGQAVTSSVVAVAQSPFLSCYCTPVTSGTGTDGITNVTLGPLVSASSATNASPYYTDYSASQTAGTLQIPALFQGGTASVSVTMGSDGTQYSGVWIDFDHSGTFDTSEFFTLGTNAGANGTSVIPVTIPAGALTGQTKMRVRGGNDLVLLSSQSCTAASSATNYGEVEDYLVTIATPVACTGTPAATTATASATSVCGGTAFTLNATGIAAGTTGLSYQWQSSPAGANTFTNLGAAQATTSYSVASQTAATDYRLVVTCTASGQSVNSSVVAVAQNSFLTCYCTVVSTGTNEYIKSVTLPGTPGFTNATNANSTSGYGDFTASTSNTTTLVQGVTYTNGVSVIVRSNNANSQGGLWIDYDHSGTFDASEYTLIGSSSLTATDVTFPVTLTVPASALLGPTRMRVRWRNGVFAATDACVSGSTTWYGESEDYTVTIAACTASPATFSYGTTSSYCVSGTTDPAVVLGTGATAGTFSSTAGLTLDATTGAITLASSTPGTYTVTNTVAASSTLCGGTATTTVTIMAAPTAAFSYGTAATFCVSGTTNPTVTLNTGATAGTFTSTVGLTLNASTGAITLASSTPGTYTVTNTVAAANGCAAVTGTTTVTITNAPTAAFAFPTATTCAGSTATLTPTLSTGAIAGTFTLPAATGLSVDASTGAVTVGPTAAAGTYTVTNTVAAANGCAAATSTATFTLTTQTSAAFSYAAGPYCTSGTTTPTPTITGTAGGAFTATTGLSIDASTGAINLGSSTAGTYTVTYTVPSSATQCGSTATASVTITAPATAAFAYPTATACAGSAATLTPTLGTGATAGTYSLPTATGLSVNATTGVVTVGATAAAGTYTVTNTVAAANGCAAVTSTATFTLTAPSTATFSYPAATYCTSGTTTPTPTITGTTGGTFSSTSGLSINSSTGVISLSGSTAGTYTVTYTVSGGCGSSSTQSVTITAPAVATFSYGTSPTFCVSGTTAPAVVLGTGATAGTFTSTSGLTLNASTGAITLSSSTPGTYTVTNTVAASGGCAAVTATATVTVTPAAIANAGPNVAFCGGATATLGTTAIAGTTYAWVPATGLSSASAAQPTVTLPNTTGAPITSTYTLTAATAGGCTATATVTVTVNPTPATPTITPAYNGSTTTLTSSAATGNQWYLGPNPVPGATGQTLVLTGLPAQLGSYTVTTTNAYGCVSLPSSPLVVTSSAKAAAGTSFHVYPNPTPDGHLLLEFTGYREAVSVQVLNALGQRVYEGNVSGNALGQKQALDLSALPTGVYILQARTASGSLDVHRIVRE